MQGAQKLNTKRTNNPVSKWINESNTSQKEKNG
jgi:hypothetical protein